jgi:thiol-disulfide isomerase/thioredoxin
VRKTLLIVAAVLVPVSAIGIGLAGRLMTPPAAAPTAGTAAPSFPDSASTAQVGTRAAGSAAGPAAASSGRGVAIQFSDKPVTVPAFSLVDFDGHPMTPESWRGKVVLINFWATWCGYCVKEMPELIALQERYRDQLIIVGLSTDTIAPAEVKAFAKQARLNYPVAIAGSDVQALFGGVSGLPSTFVINPQGAIVQRHVGLLDPVLTEQEVRVLSNLPTEASVQLVKDTGQVLLANAAYATEIPGVDLGSLTPRQKADVLKRLNTEKCTCGCGLTLAQCRINDPNCTVSLPIAQKIARGK